MIELPGWAWVLLAPGERHFTYVDPGKIRRKRDPGRCFIRAGWAPAGSSQTGLILLERQPW